MKVFSKTIGSFKKLIFVKILRKIDIYQNKIDIYQNSDVFLTFIKIYSVRALGTYATCLIHINFLEDTLSNDL